MNAWVDGIAMKMKKNGAGGERDQEFSSRRDFKSTV